MPQGTKSPDNLAVRDLLLEFIDQPLTKKALFGDRPVKFVTEDSISVVPRILAVFPGGDMVAIDFTNLYPSVAGGRSRRPNG